jgi:hypothetical protein
MTPNRALLLPARLAERGDLSLEFPREPEELAFETSQPGLCESLIQPIGRSPLSAERR